MKKQTFSKLNLKKSVISGFNANLINGGSVITSGGSPGTTLDGPSDPLGTCVTRPPQCPETQDCNSTLQCGTADCGYAPTQDPNASLCFCQ